MNIYLQIIWSPAYDTSKMTRGKEIRVHILNQLLWAMHIAVRTLGEILLFRPADSSSCQVQNYWRVPSYACRSALSAVPKLKEKKKFRSVLMYAYKRYSWMQNTARLVEWAFKRCRKYLGHKCKDKRRPVDAGRGESTGWSTTSLPALWLHSAFRGLTAFGVRQSAAHKSRIAAPCF